MGCLENIVYWYYWICYYDTKMLEKFLNVKIFKELDDGIYKYMSIPCNFLIGGKKHVNSEDSSWENGFGIKYQANK